jgi:DnaK suppressor protein
MACLEEADAYLAGVESALRRLDDGTYGRCESCGSPLPDETLAADPTAVRCRACAPPDPPALTPGD